MQFLADESCDFAVVRALRAAGHDVTTAADLVGGADDTAVAGLAVSEGRAFRPGHGARSGRPWRRL